MSAGRRVLVVGKGGREHALALRLLESESVAEVVVAPGNAGTESSDLAKRWGKQLRNAEGPPLDVARALRPDLVVVGPENPLCAGLVDELEQAGVLAYGPRRAAARLEGSKAFLKEFAVRHGIRTPRHLTVRSEQELGRALSDFVEPPVVKADGLCAGKGVVVASSHEQASAAAREMLSGRAFGDAGRVVVLEERVYGSELSVHAICDGTRAWILPFVQDHKRLGEDDTGPNTGGMGTYGPVALPDPSLASYVRGEIIERIVTGMAEMGAPFRGTIFANLMLVPGSDPTLFEVNVRFGDPETQILMNLFEGDLCEVLSGAARGELGVSRDLVARSGCHALCVVLAAAGYPAEPRLQDTIQGLEAAAALSGVHVYHAGTTRQGGQTLTAGGRVLGITGVGSSLAQAHARAY
ncbi:MAG TPA: phosphoribosylamine--glycine ligase, partial [Polyangiaceae bacterium]|nr:phosphoribosylamine--glycine ligase [Polyangiaceae bacterium]